MPDGKIGGPHRLPGGKVRSTGGLFHFLVFSFGGLPVSGAGAGAGVKIKMTRESLRGNGFKESGRVKCGKPRWDVGVKGLSFRGCFCPFRCLVK
ncbi:Uncharacterized protein TCM_015753 [Theobroma cacao]|uniref:Uncharacterized protein n=1 Tax=Theobroma cacao TaxID=3641 RepID=A0A061G3A0_THECC|nr:Uncharacterized protein TCM_015753 [Theobroma cacao]